MIKLRLKNESKTLLLGAAIGSTIKDLDFQNFEIHLNGNLGAGKTTLVRGFLQYLNWRDVVTSPSYTCLLYTSPSPRDQRGSRMPSSA